MHTVQILARSDNISGFYGEKTMETIENDVEQQITVLIVLDKEHQNTYTNQISAKSKNNFGNYRHEQ